MSTAGRSSRRRLTPAEGAGGCQDGPAGGADAGRGSGMEPTTYVRDAARVPDRCRGGVVRVHARRLHRRPARRAAVFGAEPARVRHPDRRRPVTPTGADPYTRRGTHRRGLRGRDGRKPVVVGPGRPAADDRCADREPDQHRAHRPAVPARRGLPRGPQLAVGRHPAGQHPDDPAGGPRRDRNGGRGRAGPGGRTGADAVRQTTFRRSRPRSGRAVGRTRRCAAVPPTGPAGSRPPA